MMQHLSPGISAPTKADKNARGAPPRGFMKFACVRPPRESCSCLFSSARQRDHAIMCALRACCTTREAFKKTKALCSTTHVPVDGIFRVNIKARTFYKFTISFLTKSNLKRLLVSKFFFENFSINPIPENKNNNFS
jgi:hypothetical protein